MPGPAKTRALDRPVLVCLDSYVPRNHFYRHFHRVPDLSFVRALTADCYAASGRPSIDPEVFFRLQLLMFFSGIRSERQLLEQVSYNLDEPLPDHSTLSRIRARLGSACPCSGVSSTRSPGNVSRRGLSGVRS
jgi:transposase